MPISLIPAASAVSGTLPAANLPTGSVLQVVNATYGTQTTTTTNTLVDTGLTATITPKFSTSKILVLVDQQSCGKSNDARLQIALYRNATQILYVTELAAYTGANTSNNCGSVSTCYLDSPATTSATTYKTMQSNYASGVGSTFTQWNTSFSTITLMEIAG